MTWNSPCLNQGCNEAGCKRGMCRRHYNQWRRDHGSIKCRTDGCDKPSHAKGLCVNHYMKVKAYWKTNPRSTKMICCKGCGQESKVRSGSVAQYCSFGCAMKHRPPYDNGAKKKPRPVVLYCGPKFKRKPKLNVNSVATSKRTFKSVKCKVCNRYFVTLFTDVTCTIICQQIHELEMNKQGRSRRRAREKQAFVENVSPKYIFKRDNYRCKLKLSATCNGKTDPRRAVPHPRAPTVDHIIPLGVGVENDGWHSNANSWTACFQCNCIKSDRGGGEQLALIG